MQFEFSIFILNERHRWRNMVDCGIEPRSGKTKDCKICICYLSAKHESLRRKSKDWLDRNQNNVSDWNDMSTRGRLFQ